MPSTNGLDLLVGNACGRHLTDDEWLSLAKVRIEHLSPHLDSLPSKRLTEWLKIYSLECTYHTSKHSTLLAREPVFVCFSPAKTAGARSPKGVEEFWGYTRKKQWFWVTVHYEPPMRKDGQFTLAKQLECQHISLEELFLKARVTSQDICALVVKIIREWKSKLHSSLRSVENLYEVMLAENQLLRTRGHSMEPDGLLVPWNGLQRRE